MFKVEFIVVFKWFTITGIKNKTLQFLKILRHLIILIQLRNMLYAAHKQVYKRYEHDEC